MATCIQRLSCLKPNLLLGKHNNKGVICMLAASQPLRLKPTGLQAQYIRCYKGDYPQSRDSWYRDKKLGMPLQDELTDKEKIVEGSRILRESIPKFKQEMKDRYFTIHNVNHIQHMDFEYLVKFNEPEILKDWKVSTDALYHEGFTTSEFVMSDSKKGLFRGDLRVDFGKGGLTRKSGFANLRSPYNMKAFERKDVYNWSNYTHLFIKCRGDGRNYMFNLQMKREWDLMWFDMFQYPFFTHGGPYWQYIKIPFSKFFFSHGGRLQDQQNGLEANNIEHYSITLMDGNPGKFELEIDYMAVLRDENTDEDCEYELYSKEWWE